MLERKLSNLENQIKIFKDKLTNCQAVLQTKNALSELELMEFEAHFIKIEQIHYEYDEVQSKTE